jgi:L-2-hydroxyglutarate oxidase LhgO
MCAKEDDMPSLQLTKIKQQFNRPVVPDIPTTLTEELRRIEPLIRPEANITIAVGSRGIANIAEIVKTSVDFVKKQRANPFIVPAMGSHGRATAAG